jgi:chemotaxis methyl-accepting protein methylase
MVEKTVPDPEFESLLRHIQETRGLDFRGYKRTSLKRRISLRMEAVGAEDFAAYRAHLEAQPGEFEDLLNTVLINVTSFFRDAEAWEVLKTKVIPAARRRGAGRSSNPGLERRLRLGRGALFDRDAARRGAGHRRNSAAA